MAKYPKPEDIKIDPGNMGPWYLFRNKPPTDESCKICGNPIPKSHKSYFILMWSSNAKWDDPKGPIGKRLPGVENDWTDGKIHWWCGIMAEMHNPGIDLIKDP